MHQREFMQMKRADIHGRPQYIFRLFFWNQSVWKNSKQFECVPARRIYCATHTHHQHTRNRTLRFLQTNKGGRSERKSAAEEEKKHFHF